MADASRLAPADEYDARLLANVHPEDWVNPEPAPRYNLLVIGAGTAGLVAAAGAAGLGARVALVERRLMGGDCLNFGCVPSKALIRASRVCGESNHALSYGITTAPHADFGAVMERMRRVRAELSANDSAARFKSLGVDVFLGEARFGRTRSSRSRGQAAQFQPGAGRNRSTSGLAADSGARRNGVSHQRNGLLTDRVT